VFGVAASCASHPPQPFDTSAHALAYMERVELAPSLLERLAEIAPSIAPTLRFDASDGLTVDEAEVLALFFAPNLRSARAELALAVADESTAGLWEDPVLGFDGAAIVDPDSGFDYGIGLGLTMPVSGRLGAEVRQSRAELATELAAVAAAEWRTRIEVRRLWVTWSTLEALHAATLEHERALAQLMSTVGLLADRGALARTEARLIEAELARTRVEELALRQSADEARLQIALTLGVPGGAQLQLVAGVPAHTYAPAADETRTAEQRAPSYPDVVTAQLAYDAAEAALRTELRKQYPDISIGAGVGAEDDDSRFPLSLSLPLPLWNANARGIARAVASRTAARVALETQIESYLSRSLAADRRRAAATARALAIEEQLVPLVAAQSADLAALAELGRVDVIIVLESRRLQYESAVQLLEAKRDVQLAGVDAVELVGSESVDPSQPIRTDTSTAEQPR
jgi:CRISPR system Cascade subunit CasA